jgi:hypothetical protein
LTTSGDEVDPTVGLLERTIGVAPFGWWRRGLLFPVAVFVIMVVLATSFIMSVVVTIIMAIIATISPVVVTPVVAVITTVVVASVIAAVVVAIITSIPIIIARIGPVIMVISSIRSTVTIIEALTTVTVVVALGFLGGGRDSKGAL